MLIFLKNTDKIIHDNRDKYFFINIKHKNNCTEVLDTNDTYLLTTWQWSMVWMWPVVVAMIQKAGRARMKTQLDQVAPDLIQRRNPPLDCYPVSICICICIFLYKK